MRELSECRLVSVTCPESRRAWRTILLNISGVAAQEATRGALATERHLAADCAYCLPARQHICTTRTSK